MNRLSSGLPVNNSSLIPFIALGHEPDSYAQNAERKKSAAISRSTLIDGQIPPTRITGHSNSIDDEREENCAASADRNPESVLFGFPAQDENLILESCRTNKPKWASRS